jgi:hypothetical protein
VGPKVKVLSLQLCECSAFHEPGTVTDRWIFAVRCRRSKLRRTFVHVCIESPIMPNTPSAAQRPHTSQAPSTPPPLERKHSTQDRENRGLMLFFIGAGVVAVTLVVLFNVHGPEGAARSGIGDGPSHSAAGDTSGGPSPAESRAEPADQSGGAASNNGGAVGSATTAPQAPDSPTPIGREGVGAPRGAVPASSTLQKPTPGAPDASSNVVPAR